jgi:exodeoxyribonuclease-3
MKITSLNIRQGGGKRIDGLIKYLDPSSSDVFMIQEFRDNIGGSRITTHLQNHGFQYHRPDGIDSNQNSILIAAKALEPVQLNSPPNRWSIAAARVKDINFFNVYFPQKQGKRIVYEWLLKNAGDFKNTVLVGDFNTGRNDIDIQGGSKFFCEVDFKKLSSELLVDVYRHLMGDEREYSWYSSAGNGFRIDHVLCTPDLLSRMHDVSYDHVTRETLTDHSSLRFEIS